MLPWVQVSAGTYRVNRRLSYAVGRGRVGLVDLTPATIPYWELRARSPVRTGIEEPFLTAYREGCFHYLLIAADRR